MTTLRLADTGGGKWPALPRGARALAPGVLEAIRPGPPRDRLAAPGALAVTTGQQPGLFGGPMYTLHKAIAAAAAAAALERAWGVPVVPVFWLAGDDHDWAEATRTAWWGGDESVVSWALPARPAGAPQRAMRDEPLPPGALAEARDRLAADLPPGTARDETLAWVDRHWHAGATVHGAYAAGLGELLDRLGVATLDATHPAVKEAQRAILAAALRDSDRLDAALAALPDAGTGIAAGERATLVFRDGSAGRDRLVRTDTGFTSRRGGERFSEADLLAELAADPGRFSANVLLRPVVEAALFPTVAYVAGPGERRYLEGQAAALYAPLGVTAQAVIPRWGGAVIEPVAARLLERLALEPGAVLHDDGTLAREILHRDFPADATRALDALGAEIAGAEDALLAVAARMDGTLDRAVRHRTDRLMAVRDDLQRLLERHHRRRADIQWAQYRRLRLRLAPLDAPQERVIGIAGMLGRTGWAWPEAARTAADGWATAAMGGGTS